jgi:hypothetical protein
MAQIPAEDQDGGPPVGDPNRERVFRWPLVVFLSGVVGISAYGGWQRWRSPSVDEAIRWLADGDLDARERLRPLQALVAAARQDERDEVRAAGLMAAISLGDKVGYEDLCASLGGASAPVRLPAEPARELLHLGDPMLGNCLLAFAAEVGGDRAAAAGYWRQVRAQAGLADHTFGRELAEAGLLRTR